MKRDWWFAIALFLAIVCGGVAMLWPAVVSDWQGAQERVVSTQQRIDADQRWLEANAQQQREQREQVQVLHLEQITGTPGDVEREFTSSIAKLLTRNRVGLRRIEFTPPFAPDPSQAAASPDPGAAPDRLMQGRAQGAPEQSTSSQAQTAVAVATTTTPTSGSSTAPTAQTPQQANAAPAARRRGYLVRERVALELVGPYAQNLEAISELSGLPVLSEVVSSSLQRDRSDDASKNPAVQSTNVMYIYRLVQQ